MTCALIQKFLKKTHSVALLSLEWGRNKQQLPHNTFSCFLIGWKNRVLVKQYGISNIFTLDTAVDSLHFFDQQQLQHHPWRSLIISLHQTLPLLASTYLKDIFFVASTEKLGPQCRNHHSVWIIWPTWNILSEHVSNNLRIFKQHNLHMWPTASQEKDGPSRCLAKFVGSPVSWHGIF